MSTKERDDEGGVWPAYVAAMAGLVQSLLFVSAIMALALLQMGMLAGRKVDTRLADRLVAKGSKGERLRGGTGESGADAGRGAMSSVEFDEQTVLLGDQARAQLQALVRRQLAEGYRSWRLEVQVEADNVMQRRAGYLRLLVTRNAMMDSGVPSAQIVLSIREATSGIASVSAQIVRLVPSRAPLVTTPSGLPSTGGVAP